MEITKDMVVSKLDRAENAVFVFALDGTKSVGAGLWSIAWVLLYIMDRIEAMGKEG